MRPHIPESVTALAFGFIVLAACGVPRAGANYWVAQATAPVRLYVVHAVSRDVAWAAGDEGMVMRTADGGANWDTCPIVGAADLYALSGLDDQVGIAADENGAFWRTADGGLSWTHVHDAGTFINGVHFFDGQNGWAVGDPVGDVFAIVESSDGGLTWTALPNAPPGPSTNGLAGSFDWVGDQIGAFGTSAYWIWRTGDGGSSWFAHPTSMRDVYALALSDGGLGLAAGATVGPGLDRSTDYGATWEPIPNPRELLLGQLDFAGASDEVWGVAAGGIFRSTNGGFDWAEYPLSGGSAYYLHFADAFTGWAVGWGSLHPGQIWKYVPTTTAAETRPNPARLRVWNHPNPFRAETVFGVEVGSAGAIQLVIYDVAGRQVAALAGPASSEQRMELRWDGRDSSGRQLREGVYFYRLTCPGGEASGRLIRIR